MKRPLLSFIVLLTFIILSSCINDNIIEENSNQTNEKNETNFKNENNSPTNFDLIQENLQKFHNTLEFQNRATLLYYCSEELGTYTSYPYLNQGYYLNALYAPPQAPNLQDLFNSRFRDPNASGNNYIAVNIVFDIYTDGVYLDATESNRVYNEFICRLNALTNNIQKMESQNQSKSSPLKKYNIDFIVDYKLCCVGTSCCYPEVNAIGGVYY